MGKTVRRAEKRSLDIRPDPEQMKQALEMLEVRNSPIHRKGVFARRDIPVGVRLIQYCGRKITKEEADELCLKRNPYIFTLNDEFDVNGRVSWNPARLINHGCEPNCDTEQDDSDGIWVRSIRPIAEGEELTYNYGYTLDDFQDYPCRCGAPSCLGYMVAEDLFPIVRRLLAGESLQSAEAAS